MSANETSFKPGNPGGPGRPRGARDKLSFAFIEALNKTFEEKGVASLEQLMEKQPAQYHSIIAKLMPKLMELSGPDGDAIPISGVVRFIKGANANSDE